MTSFSDYCGKFAKNVIGGGLRGGLLGIGICVVTLTTVPLFTIKICIVMGVVVGVYYTFSDPENDDENMDNYFSSCRDELLQQPAREVVVSYFPATDINGNQVMRPVYSTRIIEEK